MFRWRCDRYHLVLFLRRRLILRGTLRVLMRRLHKRFRGEALLPGALRSIAVAGRWHRRLRFVVVVVVVICHQCRSKSRHGPACLEVGTSTSRKRWPLVFVGWCCLGHVLSMSMSLSHWMVTLIILGRRRGAHHVRRHVGVVLWLWHRVLSGYGGWRAVFLRWCGHTRREVV